MAKDDITVPEGLRELLQEFTVAVLRQRPTSLVDFAYNYFKMKKQDKDDVDEDANSNSDSDSDILPARIAPGSIPRRKGVAGESFDPEKEKDLPKVKHPKTEEQRTRLRKAIKDITLFNSLDEEQVEDVVDAMFERKVEDGERVITAGEDGDNFYVIETGVYDIQVPDGDQMKTVGQYNGKGSFGELALMYNTPRAATIIARGPGVVWAMTRIVFRGIVLKKAFEKRKMYEQLLNQVPMLESLSAYERMNIADALRTRIYEPGKCIIRQGDPGNEMFFIEEGEVHIRMTSDDGQEKELSKITTGAYFGELALITKHPRAASAYAHQKTRLAVLDVNSFERLLGPCSEILQRNIDKYNDQLKQIFGSLDRVPELRK